ncbi:MAG: cupin domain-containing protein [Kiritimatiellae bacterium]|nr:cupin domain-containing protein [Kiritimatiellia bacterium]
MITRDGEMRAEMRENMRGGKGTVKVENWFAPEAFGAKVRLCARLTVPPGGSIGTHNHEDEDEIYIVLSGQGLIIEDNNRTPVGAGDAILTGKGGAHGVENTGTEPLVIAAIIMLYA